MLTPIRYLAPNIENVFLTNSEEFQEVVESLVDSENKLKIKIESDVNKGIRECNCNVDLQTGEIKINEFLLCALWSVCYFLAELTIKLDQFLKSDENNPNLLISNSAIDLLKYAISLVPCFNEWDFNLPKPQDFDEDPCSNLANEIFKWGVNCIICHEIAHLYLNHSAGIEEEKEADKKASEWILNNEQEEYPIKELAVMSAYVCMFILDFEAFENKIHHPSSFNRFCDYLLGLRLQDNDILWLVGYLIKVARKLNFLEVPKIPESIDNNFKELFLSLN